MWTLENRAKYNRDHLRYPSDLTDDEWAYVEPLIPPAKPGGGKRRTDMRAVMNGVMYILSTGCQWRYLPKDFPPRSTVHNYFVWWQCDRVLDRIHHALYVECRDKAEREASPTAAIIDSQSVKSAEKGGGCIDPHGFDAGKLIKGKKRHILVDTLGLLLHAIRRSDHAKGFVRLPKRWIVERTIAWLNRCRRLAKDWENLNRNALAFLKLASIRLMLRKLCYA